MHPLGHEIVVRRRQRERQQDGYGHRHRSARPSVLVLVSVGPGVARSVKRELTTQRTIVTSGSCAFRVELGIGSLAEKAETPGYMGIALRPRGGRGLARLSCDRAPARRQHLRGLWPRHRPVPRLPRHPSQPPARHEAASVAFLTRRARLPRRAAGRRRRQPEPGPHAQRVTHVLQVPRAARHRQERRHSRGLSAEVAPFGAEASDRAESDGAG